MAIGEVLIVHDSDLSGMPYRIEAAVNRYTDWHASRVQHKTDKIGFPSGEPWPALKRLIAASDVVHWYGMGLWGRNHRFAAGKSQVITLHSKEDVIRKADVPSETIVTATSYDLIDWFPRARYIYDFALFSDMPDPTPLWDGTGRLRIYAPPSPYAVRNDLFSEVTKRLKGVEIVESGPWPTANPEVLHQINDAHVVWDVFDGGLTCTTAEAASLGRVTVYLGKLHNRTPGHDLVAGSESIPGVVGIIHTMSVDPEAYDFWVTSACALSRLHLSPEGAALAYTRVYEEALCCSSL